MCGDHERDHNADLERRSERDELVNRIYAAGTFDDLKDVLVDIVDQLADMRPVVAT